MIAVDELHDATGHRCVFATRFRLPPDAVAAERIMMVERTEQVEYSDLCLDLPFEPWVLDGSLYSMYSSGCLQEGSDAGYVMS